MTPNGRSMALTPELVALCHREVTAGPPDPRYDNFTDADYDRAITQVLDGKPEGPFWLFASGSLIWKPEVIHVERRKAIAKGWHRAFSMRIEAYRGTPEQPGYMMCLDRGGHCEGVILRLPEDDQIAQLNRLLKREVGSHEQLESARWIEVETSEGPVMALTFYAHPRLLDYYQEGRPQAEIVHGLARACGHWGSGAAYLHNTVSHLEALGIHDEALWTLQEMVAAEIIAIHGKR